METKLDHLAVLAPNWVGDLVMATPVLEAAVASPSFGRVTVLVRSHLAALLAAWGSDDPAADIDEDGVVGPADLALLLANWTG